MSRIGIGLIMFLLLLPAFVLRGQETLYQETWCIDNLSQIGEHGVICSGDPEVVSTKWGKAVRFDGDDMLLVEANPVGEAKEFTIEVIFKPEGYYPVNKDPRFVHIQDPDDLRNKRVMIELRTTPDNQFYLDGFVLTDTDDLALIDSTLIHPSFVWHHAAVTFKDGQFKTYMDGKEELCGFVKYDQSILGAGGLTSLGARMDERNWYAGLIKTIKVSHRVLDTSEFLEIYANEQNNN